MKPGTTALPCASTTCVAAVLSDAISLDVPTRTIWRPATAIASLNVPSAFKTFPFTIASVMLGWAAALRADTGPEEQCAECGETGDSEPAHRAPPFTETGRSRHVP